MKPINLPSKIQQPKTATQHERHLLLTSTSAAIITLLYLAVASFYPVPFRNETHFRKTNYSAGGDVLRLIFCPGTYIDWLLNLIAMACVLLTYYTLPCHLPTHPCVGSRSSIFTPKCFLLVCDLASMLTASEWVNRCALFNFPTEKQIHLLDNLSWLTWYSWQISLVGTQHPPQTRCGPVSHIEMLFSTGNRPFFFCRHQFVRRIGESSFGCTPSAVSAAARDFGRSDLAISDGSLIGLTWWCVFPPQYRYCCCWSASSKSRFNL